jgi:hypothetical protein
MRLSVLIAVLAGVVVGGALLAACATDEDTTSASRGTVTLVGDSLNVGIEPYLQGALKGWRFAMNDRVGRSTAEGIDEIEARRPVLSSHVVLSLGTNDSQLAVATFRADVERVLELAGPNRCVVWATIWRDGKPNGAFNEVLRNAAADNRRFRVVDWAAMVDEQPDWLAVDGVHGTETGYRERARAVAEAVTGCVPGQTASG